MNDLTREPVTAAEDSLDVVEARPTEEPVAVRIARRILDNGTPYTRHERERLAFLHLPDILANLDSERHARRTAIVALDEAEADAARQPAPALLEALRTRLWHVQKMPSLASYDALVHDALAALSDSRSPQESPDLPIADIGWKPLALSLRSTMRGIAEDRTVTSITNARAVAVAAVERADRRVAQLDALRAAAPSDRPSPPNREARWWRCARGHVFVPEPDNRQDGLDAPSHCLTPDYYGEPCGDSTHLIGPYDTAEHAFRAVVHAAHPSPDTGAES